MAPSPRRLPLPQGARCVRYARPMSDLVMLDFDGVIADSLDCTEEAVRAAFKQHGLTELSQRITMDDLVAVNWFEALAKAGVPPEVVRAIDDNVAGLTAKGLLRPYAGMVDVIERLSWRHTVVGMTSNRTDIVEECLSQWNVKGVHETLGGDKGESKVVKIRRKVKEHGLTRAWFVGDTTGDLLEGREAGVTTVAAGWGWHSHGLLLTAGPDYVLERPEDLLSLLAPESGL